MALLARIETPKIDASDADKKSESAVQGTREEIKESFSKKKFAINLLMYFLSFSTGACFTGLWLKFISFRTFEVDWGMDYFREPKMLAAMAVLFFLTGMGLVSAIRHIIIWIRECRTY